MHQIQRSSVRLGVLGEKMGRRSKERGKTKSGIVSRTGDIRLHKNILRIDAIGKDDYLLINICNSDSET